MADAYRVKAPVVRVRIGTLEGNHVPWVLRAGGIVPAGVARETLDSLEDRGLIEKVAVEPELESVGAVEVPEADSPEDEQQSPKRRRAAVKK